MRYGSDDTIFGFEGRLHNFGGIRFRQPLRYSTWLAILAPLALAIPVLFVVNVGVFMVSGSRFTWFLLLVSAALAFPGALFFASACAFWLMAQVKKDRGLRGVLEMYRCEIRAWRTTRRLREPRPVRVCASKVRRRETS